MKEKLFVYAQLMRLDKPIGILLLLWPTWWALWLADTPSLKLFIVFTLGVILMRSAGCVINDFADRDFDGHVTRTKNRPLASQRVSEKEAKILFVVLVLCAFLLVLTLNYQAILLSCLALATAVLYPFMKRFTHLPQLFLGLAFSWGIPMVYAASIASFPLTCWLLCVANICWTIAYDTQYAMADREDDLKIGIKSTAILFGSCDKLIIGLLQLVTVAILFWVGLINHLGYLYILFLLIGCAIFVYQQRLIHERKPASCFRAFLNNNYFGLLIFIGIVLASLV
ncbi:4-hydroxybenzoate octaprenyltransferase [Utexia brackfieldae]|uniref:4-hydroxybenzoate octaprenyltransferase n=1 Tax=Utexia brackfieldae TaxID=3074108 RepID=UPI00370DC425